MIKRIAVIGGGASGMMAAITAARQGAKVTIYESKERLGKKILATGNGKCNYTNLYQEDSCYRGTHPEFSKPAREQMTVEKTLQFFEEIGILPKMKNGYVYPNSEQAVSVADALRIETDALGIRVVKEEIREIDKSGKAFCLREAGQKKYYDSVILCVGSCAGFKDREQFFGYQLAEKLGHTIQPVRPALVQLRCREKWFSTIAGVRCEGRITLYAQQKKLAQEKGELLFTEYGLSGIPVLQLSRYAGEELDNGRKVTAKIDFFDSMTVENVFEHLYRRWKHSGTRTAEEMLIGFMNHKLNYVILKECMVNPTDPAAKAFRDKDVLYRIAKKYKEFTCCITGYNPFVNAQVCAGGVSTDELDPETMESKILKGLYMAGELLDIDGTCGGYNLQWAWSSGYTAGFHAATEGKENIHNNSQDNGKKRD